MGTVIRRSTDAKGRVIGSYNDNPLLNTVVYDVQFDDGTIKEYAANVIAENIWMETDAEGYHSRAALKIVGHKSTGEAVKMSDKYIVTKSGQRWPRRTTVGWQLLVEWDDQTRQWTDLKLLKEANPVLVAEYATSRGIQDEPVFAWWVPYTLCKRDVIISAVGA